MRFSSITTIGVASVFLILGITAVVSADDQLLIRVDNGNTSRATPAVDNAVNLSCEQNNAGAALRWIRPTPTVLNVTSSDRHLTESIQCEGTYQHHLQGVCTDGEAIYWSFTTQLVKTDHNGKLLHKVPVVNHHGDLCFHDGQLYVAVNLGKFNDPEGNADSWVYVYDAQNLTEVAKHPVQEVFHGAGGIGYREDRFFVVGGLPNGFTENYVYEYDRNFTFQKKHTIQSGHTLLGIQTATFAVNRCWFGCYGDPKILLVTDAEFNMIGRHEKDCSLGIEGLTAGRLLVASGRCQKDKGCTGMVRFAIPDKTEGFTIEESANDIPQ